MKTLTCIDKDKNTYEVPVSELQWRPSVYAIIIQEGKILLVPEWDGYDLPGGGIELGETIKEGLIREVKEETGLDIKIGELIESETSFFKHPNPKKGFFHSILLYYTATPIGGALSVEGFQGDEKEYAKMAEWIDLSEIEKINLYSSVDLLPIIHKAIS